MIADTVSFELGRYTVWQRPRFDSPAWAVYLVYLGDRLIGKSFSRPDIGQCQRLEREGRIKQEASSIAPLSWATDKKRACAKKGRAAAKLGSA